MRGAVMNNIDEMWKRIQQLALDDATMYQVFRIAEVHGFSREETLGTLVISLQAEKAALRTHVEALESRCVCPPVW
jgi:hypothetical protein